MSLRQDLINNISSAINMEFNGDSRDYHIYTDDSNSEPIKPYFMILDISPNRKKQLNNNYLYNELIIVQYHGNDNSTSRLANIYDVSERLYDCLEVVNGTRAVGIEMHITDGVLSFQANYKFRAKRVTEKKPIEKVIITTRAE